MPGRLKRECRKIGCLNLTDSADGYCDAHSREVYLRYDRQRQNSNERGYNYRWSKYRRWFLTKNPLCVTCGRAATVVDHIIPHKGNEDLFWYINNHQALCKRCHDIKTTTEDGGFGNKNFSRK